MTTTSDSGRSGSKNYGSYWIWGALALVLLAGAGLGSYYWVNGGQGQADQGLTAQVQRGELLVTISEKGEIEAAESEVIRNELPWSATIVYIVENGTPVEAGDRVVEFECEKLETEIEEERLAVDSAKESLLRAERSLELKEKELDNKLANSRQSVEDAKADLERYLKGQFPIQLTEHEQEIAIAERARRLAEEKLNFKLKINEDPKLGQPYSENDLKAEKLAVDRLKLSEQRAKSKLEMLKKYDHPRERQRYQANVRSAELALERDQLEHDAQLSIARTELKYKEKNLRDRTEKLSELETYKNEHLVVEATRDGYVDYRQDGPWWQWIQLKVGTEVRRKHQIMIIPDISSLQIETQVFEAMIERLKSKMEENPEVGVKAFVRLEARPGEVLSGHVKWVAPQPKSQDRRRNPGVKVFRVLIELEGEPGKMGLTTNMSCSVEIVLDMLDNALHVPVAAVFAENQDYFVYKIVDGQPVKTYVEVGGSNEKRVQIVSGLAEGDQVRLTPPEEDSSQEKNPASEPEGQDEQDEASIPSTQV